EIEAMAERIAAAEATLADPALYTRDPRRFAAVNAEAEALRARQAEAEERWLMLAGRQEALAG
ncbi:MAG: ABC transporter ATP-binding protein, partial [Sphingomonadaceae bacterium]|nr:ABC transporter ATP-binding protein [Sphingomonadaceae bacterium]